MLQHTRFKNGIRLDFEYLVDKIMNQNDLHLIANFYVTVSNSSSREIFSNNIAHRKRTSNFTLNSIAASETLSIACEL